MAAEMRTVPESDYRRAIAAVVELLKRQSSISEEELLGAFSASAFLAMEGKERVVVSNKESGGKRMRVRENIEHKREEGKLLGVSLEY